MTKSMQMLERLKDAAKFSIEKRAGATGCLVAFGGDLIGGLQEIIDGIKESDASIERSVRDAICSYEESYPSAPNDDCERELRERAEIANKWLVDHGFEPEKFTWSKEEPPCL